MGLENADFERRGGSRLWTPSGQRGIATSVQFGRQLYTLDSSDVAAFENEGDTGREFTASTRSTLTTLGTRSRTALQVDASGETYSSSADKRFFRFMSDGSATTIYIAYQPSASQSTILSTIGFEDVSNVGALVRTTSSTGALGIYLSNGTSFCFQTTGWPLPLTFHVACIRWSYERNEYSIRIDGVERLSGTWSNAPVSGDPEQTLKSGLTESSTSKIGEFHVVRGWDEDDHAQSIEDSIWNYYQGPRKIFGTVPQEWAAESDSRASRSATLQKRSWQAHTPNSSDYLQELPSWLVIACASTNRTSQVGTSSVKVNYAADTARAVSRDGLLWGLLLEQEVTNWIHYSHQWASAGWTTTATAPTISNGGDSGPDGGIASASTLTGTATGGVYFSELEAPANTGSPVRWSVSFWAKNTGNTANVHSITNAAVGGVVWDAALPSIDSDEWATYSRSGDATVAGRMYPWLRNTSYTAAWALSLWGAQLEMGSYPTSTIVTTGASATRLADVLYVDSIVDFFPDGYLDLMIDFAPIWSESLSDGDATLLWIDEDNLVFFRASDAKIVVTIDGAEVVTSSALTFSAFQRMQVRLRHNSSQLELIVDGASTGDGTATAATVPSALSLATATNLYLFGTSAGSEEGWEMYGIHLGGDHSVDEFEFGWVGSYITAIGTLDQVSAAFGDGVISPLASEDTFTNWDPTWASSLSTTEAASFEIDFVGTLGAYEPFDGWTSSAYITSIGSSVAAEFTVGGAEFEGFEFGDANGWPSFATSIATSSAANFDSGGTPEAVEDFEEVFLRHQVTTTLSTDTFTTWDGGAHGHVVDDVLTFESDGSLPGGVQADILYRVRSVPTSSTFTIKDPDDVLVDLTTHPTDSLYAVPDKTKFWTEEV